VTYHLSLLPTTARTAHNPVIEDFNLTWVIGAPVEDTISAMQLITRGIPSRYPDIKIINSHLGGALPMLLQRADNQYLWANPDTPELPSVAARRMWYDTVGHGHVPGCAAPSNRSAPTGSSWAPTSRTRRETSSSAPSTTSPHLAYPPTRPRPSSSATRRNYWESDPP
jgi:hypothetical protein